MARAPEHVSTYRVERTVGQDFQGKVVLNGTLVAGGGSADYKGGVIFAASGELGGRMTLRKLRCTREREREREREPQETGRGGGYVFSFFISFEGGGIASL